MKFFIDTANLDEIREAASWGVIAGVTTNPSLIVREGRDLVGTIAEICEIVDGPISAEVVVDESQPGAADAMVRQGRLLAQIHDNVIIKVPLTEAGISACSRLSADGIGVNVTLCFQASQALLAARAGARFISPFIGRIDDVGTEGMLLIEQIVQIYGCFPDLNTEVLAASIRHPLHVTQAALAGADVATVPYGVLKKLFHHPLTAIGNAKFNAAWEGAGDADIERQVREYLARRDG